MPPEFGSVGTEKLRGFGSCRRGRPRAVHQRDRRLVTDRAVRANLMVVSTPSLHFRPRVVKAHEPVSVQALCQELAVKRLDEAVVGRLARAGEVEPLVDAPRARICFLEYSQNAAGSRTSGTVSQFENLLDHGRKLSMKEFRIILVRALIFCNYLNVFVVDNHHARKVDKVRSFQRLRNGWLYMFGEVRGQCGQFILACQILLSGSVNVSAPIITPPLNTIYLLSAIQKKGASMKPARSLAAST